MLLLIFFLCLYILCRLLIVYYVVLAYYIKENKSIARTCYLDLWSIVLCLHIIWTNFKSPIHIHRLMIYCRVLALCNNLLLPISICFSILDWHAIIFKGVLMAYIINYYFISKDINCHVIPYYYIHIVLILFNATCQFIVLLQFLVFVLFGNNIHIQIMSYYMSYLSNFWSYFYQ